MFRLICMSFDGDYVTEGRDFKTPKDAGNRSQDMGSRWFFYPFHFTTSQSGQTVKEAPEILVTLNGKRVKTVAELFKRVSEMPKAKNADPEEFALLVLSEPLQRGVK